MHKQQCILYEREILNAYLAVNKNNGDYTIATFVKYISHSLLLLLQPVAHLVNNNE